MNAPSAANEAVRQRLADLKLSLSSDIPYRLDKIFPKLQGWGARKELKRKVSIINRIEPRLNDMLMEQ